MRLFLHIHTLSRCQRLTSRWWQTDRHWPLHQTFRQTPILIIPSSCHPIHTCVPNVLFFFSSFSRLRLRRICSTNETFALRTSELIDYLYKRGYNRYFLQREIQRVNNNHKDRSTYAPWHFHTGQNRTCSLRYHLQHSPSFHLVHYSQTCTQFHILISSPRCYNVFKASPIVAYRRGSNLSDFLASFAIPHNTTSPGAHTHAENTVLLANTYLTDKLHTHSTPQVKPDLSLITSTVTQKTSFTRYNATTAPNNT